MATNVEIQKLFIYVPKDLAEYFMANTANSAVVDPKKIYFFEDGRIWTNGRAFSKSDAEFKAIFDGIYEKISVEQARALAAEQLLQSNIDAEAAAREKAVADEAAAREQAVADEAAAREQAVADEAAARQAAIEAEAAARTQADDLLRAAIEQAVADAKSYSVAKVEGDELIALGTTIKEAYKLVDEDGVKCGEYIKIYKDSAIKSVAYSGQTLIITYILSDGSESEAVIDMKEMIIEAEHGDGLQVNEAGVVSVKRDAASEEFLSVSADGIKLAGVQAAIDAAVAAEKEERIAKDEDLARNIDAMGDNLAKNVDKLAGIIKAEEERAIAKEESLDTAIKAEAERAKGAENQLQLNIENEAELRAQDVTKLAGIIDKTKSDFNAELASATEALNSKIADEKAERIAKDEDLARNIDAMGNNLAMNVDKLAGIITAEEERAAAAEAALQDAIIAANEAHAQDIDDVKGLIDAEVTTREQADKDEIVAREAAIAAEAGVREAADADLAAAIKAEEERAIAVENTKVDWTYLGGERKAITLANHDLLLGTSTSGITYNIGMISKWDVVDLGTTSLPINLNTPAGVRPTVQEAGKSGEEAEKIAFLSDVESANKALAEEAAARKSADENLDFKIQAVNTLLQQYTDQAVAKEAARTDEAIAAEAKLREEGDNKLVDLMSGYNEAYNARFESVETKMQNEAARIEGIISDEAAAREAGDKKLAEDLAYTNGILSNTQRDLNNEITRSNAFDEASLERDRVEKEERIAKDAELAQAITDAQTQAAEALQTAIDAEKAERIAKDEDLARNIDAMGDNLAKNVDKLAGLISDEAAARQAADDKMAEEFTTAIDAEKEERIAKDEDLARNIDAMGDNLAKNVDKLAGIIKTEEERAIAAEGKLAEDLASEAQTARDAEKANADAIVAEAARAEKAEDEITAHFDEVTSGINNKVNAKVKELQDAIAQSVAEHTYSVVKLSADEVAALSDASNVKEAFKVIDGNSLQCGETIKVYKDSALKSVALEDVQIDGEADTQNLVLTYILVDGNEQVVKVDISQFVSEAEHKAGLQVINGEVSVKIAEDSESFLSVSEAGVKLAGVQTAIDSAMTAEKERAEAEEARIEEKLDAEISRSNAKDDELYAAIGSVNNTMFIKVAELNQAISDEATRAQGIEAELAQSIADEQRRAEAAEQAEQQRAEAAEDAISKALAQEIADREGEIARVEFDYAEAVANEVAAREAAVATEKADREAAVAAEKADREAADAELQSKLDAEAATARAAEKANADAIAQEIADREGEIARVEFDYAEAVATEKSERQAADTDLQDKLDEEAQRAKDAEQAEADRAIAEEAAIREEMAVLAQQALDNLNAGKAELQQALAAEAAAREAADNTLTANLDAEAAIARAAEEANANVIAAEAATARAAEGKLTEDLASEAATARAAEGKLTEDLASEAATRLAEDQKLTNALVAESDRAKAQEDTIEAAIGLNADGTHVTPRTNYTGLATTIAGEIDLLDKQLKSTSDALTQEVADRKAADAKEIEDRQKADADILSKLQQHSEDFGKLIAAEDQEVREYAEELVKGAKSEAATALAAHKEESTGKVSLADKTRQLIKLALAEKSGKIDDTTNDTYLDVTYSEHNVAESKVSDGIVTGDVLVSVLDNLWETFATA